MNVERDNGTVAVGKYADIIAVRGSPLRDTSVLRNVDIVIRRGTVIR
jgi:imidazolonepropionase-like amidohydrolase